MSEWIERLSGVQLVLLVLAILLGLTLLALLLGALLVRAGMRKPWVLDRASTLAERALGLIKRPLTIVVLDEVAAVIQTGHYTKNISDALVENHDELKRLVTEKVSHDPNVRLISRLPGYQTVVGEVTETTLRVLIEMLADPRTDELIRDLLRNNLEQIRIAVHAREHERIAPHAGPDTLSAREQQLRSGLDGPASRSASRPASPPTSRPATDSDRRFLGGPGAI